MRAVSTLLWIVCLAGSAQAGDGVLEINQACAAGPGCFLSDTPGLPVQIQFPGSYRLTGNLNVPNGSTSAITILATYVTLDLNGFAIEGPNVFFGPGQTCSAPGSGVGISSLASNVAISNGHVRGMGSHGIQLSPTGVNFRIDGVIAEQNCGDGISVGNNSLVTDSVARRNAGRGISGGGVVQVRNSVADFNAGSGIFQGGSSGRWLVQGSVTNGNGAHGIDLPDNNGQLVMDSTATNNAQIGINLGNNSLVLRSTGSGNLQRGVSTTSSCGIGFVSANSNGTNVFGAPVLMACNVIGGAQSCPP